MTLKKAPRQKSYMINQPIRPTVQQFESLKILKYLEKVKY